MRVKRLLHFAERAMIMVDEDAESSLRAFESGRSASGPAGPG
jgi:hypothetical protein